jgi:hypothetical protein
MIFNSSQMPPRPEPDSSEPVSVYEEQWSFFESEVKTIGFFIGFACSVMGVRRASKCCRGS